MKTAPPTLSLNVTLLPVKLQSLKSADLAETAPPRRCAWLPLNEHLTKIP